MIFLNVDKTYRYIEHAAHVSKSKYAVTADIGIVSDDKNAQTDDYELDDSVLLDWGFDLDEFGKEIRNLVYTKEGEIKTRPSVVANFYEVSSDNVIGKEIVAAEEDLLTYRVPVNTRVLCRVSINDPDNIGYSKNITSIKLRDLLGHVQLPGDRIGWNHKQGYVQFIFSSDKTGVSKIRLKDNLFIGNYELSGYEFKFTGNVIESLVL